MVSFNANRDMMSDGKRMRVIWVPGDGDGDSTSHVVKRSMNLIKGHPTWRIYTEDVRLPIERGSEEEPPHYVYLDDRACNAIWCSQAYTKDELREFWPWDFNHQGHIKEGRKNRGNPGFLDDSCTVFAQGRLRRKDQWYTFSGDPDMADSRLTPRKSPSKGGFWAGEKHKLYNRGLDEKHDDRIGGRAGYDSTFPLMKETHDETIDTPTLGTTNRLLQSARSDTLKSTGVTLTQNASTQPTSRKRPHTEALQSETTKYKRMKDTREPSYGLFAGQDSSLDSDGISAEDEVNHDTACPSDPEEEEDGAEFEE